jgi:hypothetical protein
MRSLAVLKITYDARSSIACTTEVVVRFSEQILSRYVASI